MNTQSSLVKQLVARVSVTKSAAPKAAEGQPQSKTCRNLHGARSREAFWTAAVLLPLLSRRLPATDSFNHTQEKEFGCLGGGFRVASGCPVQLKRTYENQPSSEGGFEEP